ncbi:MAG: orotidine-5'-phosphate decarboxylase [Candidatus Koribacter versatilis]|uniref:Orotidine 5'-phosphate decarboxylase n=1 Tax=Candidatus Korobacter versatilis TaxID=658062 RepID=A0A932A5Z9_9BACT|nr:orotidine-5'-phosphate decarboxylase [Candidatus Koribacter versatilis]
MADDKIASQKPPATGAFLVPTRAEDRLIVALDVASVAEAQRIVGAVGEGATTYKVGKQLFVAEGPRAVRDLVSSGRRVFLDLKFHDIPNTVAGAVKAAADLGVSMLTVHAAGGSKMLRAAAEAAAATKNQPMVLAVTVLTSMGQAELQETGVVGKPQEQVVRLASLARIGGCSGVVASPEEVAELRRILGSNLVIVTPGVRPAGAAKGDQKRVATPAEAIKAGANYLVVGRPITGAADMGKAARDIVGEIAGAV